MIGIDVLGLALVVSVLGKIQPVSLSSLVNHCRSLTSSVILHLPHLFWPALVATLLVVLAASLIRTIGGLIHLRHLTTNLSANSKSSKKFGYIVGKLGLECQAVLVENNQAFAFCAGILSPKIFVSTALCRVCGELELEAILRHERAHLRNQDTLTMFVAHISQSLFPFFPILSDFMASYKAAREIAADNECVRGLKTKRPLVKILTKILTLEAPQVAFAPAMTNLEGWERRLRTLVGANAGPYQYQTKNVIFTLLAAAFLIGTIFSPVEAVELHGSNQDVTLVCVNHPSSVGQNYSLPASRISN